MAGGLNRSAQATAYYWDDNGTTAGTSLTPTGTWDVAGSGSAFFSTTANGTGATTSVTTTAADTLQFTAGPTAGQGTFVVTVSGTQTIGGLIMRQTGAFTLTGGTINLGAGGIDNSLRNLLTTNDATGFTIASAINMTASQQWFTNVGNGTNSTTLISGNTTGTGNLTLNNGSGRAFNITGGLNMVGSLNTTGGNSGSPITITGVIGTNVTGVNVGFGSIGNILRLSSTSATVGNTYTGVTSVTAGTFSLNNTVATATGSLTGAGAVTVTGSGAGLAGSGGVSSGLLTVSSGGQIAPGAVAANAFQSVGILHVGTVGGVSLNAGAVLNFDLATTAAGASDRIILGTGTTATGALTLGGSVTFNFQQAILASTTIQTGTAYTLIQSTATAGFDPANITTNFGGTLAGQYTATYTSDGSNLFVTFAPVPEPSTVAGIAVLLAGFGWRGYRRRRGLSSRRTV